MLRAMVPLVAALAAARCATPPAGGWPVAGTPATPGAALPPPTFDEMQAWLSAIAGELNGFVADVAHLLPPADQLDLVIAAAEFQKDVTAVTAALGQNPAAIKDTLTVLAALIGLFPGAAPFQPVLVALEAIIVAYLGAHPVSDPAGTPLPVPKPPPQAAMQSLHAATLAMRKQ
jgi:hypothetical protein